MPGERLDAWWMFSRLGQRYRPNSCEFSYCEAWWCELNVASRAANFYNYLWPPEINGMAAETRSFFAWVGSMLDELLPIEALAVAMFLGMVAAEKAVAMTQRKFRFSIRGLMLLTALVSFGLMIVVSVMRK